MKQKMTFDEWMAAVDAAMEKKPPFVTSAEIEDYRYRDEYDAGAGPARVAREALKAAGWEND